MGVLFEPLNEILGNQAKIRLLRALFASDAELGVREAARHAQISHVAALRPLDELALLGIVNRTVRGRQHSYRLNPDNYLYASLKILFDQERLRLKNLFDSLKRLLKPHRVVVGAYLVGSAVRGEDKPGSDLDTLVIIRDARSADALTETLASEALLLRDKFGLRLSPVVLSRKHFAEMHRKGDAFATNAVRDARVVIGPPLDKLVHGAQ